MTDQASRNVGGEDPVAVLSSLYQTEISANVGELQAGSSIMLGLLAYFAATVLVVRDDDLGAFLLLLPLGALFLCSYHLLRAAVVVRRANLARHYERALLASLGDDAIAGFDAGQLGSPYYGRVDDVGLLITQKPRGWRSASVVAAFSYFGLYGMSIGYAALVVKEAWDKSDVGWLVVAISGYSLLFVVFAVFAVNAFFRPQPALKSLAPLLGGRS